MRQTAYGLFLLPAALVVLHCERSPSVNPVFQYPGYRVHHMVSIHHGTRDRWETEGNIMANARPDSSLQLIIPGDSQGGMLWLKDRHEGDLQLEYQITFSDSSGMHVVYLCAEIRNTESRDAAPDSAAPPGSYAYYANFMRGYQVGVHSFDANMRHHPHCRLRKNPGQLLLSHSGADPCRFSATYLIDYIKIGNRLQFFVDEARIHDVRDKGVYNPVYSDGQVGLWFGGAGVTYSVIVKRVNLFKLTPK